MIEISDFEKVEVRVGTVLAAIENRKARNPAYVLFIDFGPDYGVKIILFTIIKQHRCSIL